MDAPSQPTRRPRPLIGYIIAGVVGWILLVTALVLTAPRFLDDGETRTQTAAFFVTGFLLGGTTYHLLWGRQIRFGLKKLLVLVFLVAVLCGLALNWEYIPGTLYTDRHGFPHGTGWKRYYYDTGELMIEVHYRASVTDRTTWYKPNGEVIATTIWDKDDTNVGYFLHQDGSIREKMLFRYDPESRMFVNDGTPE
jgi:hypothetical protein